MNRSLILRIGYGLLAVAVVTADLVTKARIIERFPVGRGVEVIPGFFSLTHVRNSGIIFGIASSLGPETTRVILSAAGILLLLFLSFYSLRNPPRDFALQIGIHLIMGGAVGNIADRVRYGSVTDFLDFYIRTSHRYFHWWTFNLADTAIMTGVILLLLHALLSPPAERGDSAESLPPRKGV
ncbi:MAG: signal peptidase II [Thermoanaerobaculia bacterium]